MEFNGFSGFKEVLDLIFEVLKRSLGLVGWAGLVAWVAKHTNWLKCLASWLIAAPRFLRRSQLESTILHPGVLESNNSSLLGG